MYMYHNIECNPNFELLNSGKKVEAVAAKLNLNLVFFNILLVHTEWNKFIYSKLCIKKDKIYTVFRANL